MKRITKREVQHLVSKRGYTIGKDIKRSKHTYWLVER